MQTNEKRHDPESAAILYSFFSLFVFNQAIHDSSFFYSSFKTSSTFTTSVFKVSLQTTPPPAASAASDTDHQQQLSKENERVLVGT